MAKRRRKTAQRPVWPLVFMLSGAALLVLAIVWTVFLQDRPVTGTPSAQTTATANQALIPFPEVTRVEVDEAFAAYQSGEAVLVDVRGEPWYSQSHIEGAISVPYDDIAANLGELDPQDQIITYCT